MRMIRGTHELASEGSIATRQTTIGGDAKIVFAILSGMVTDSIEYCIREPGTNAWEANLKQPFELTLPTRWNSTIKFRDFGKGLSDTFMMERYAKIGESTKDADDNAVGGWGFGSKSPLAYLMSQEGAGAYTVISRYRGVRSVYVIGLNEAGKIQITCLAQDPMDETDRGTGIEVSFPVRDSDIPRFTQYVDRIFWGFNPQPVILPLDANRPALGRGTVKSTGAGWTLYDSRDLPWSGPHIRIGCVLYPVQLTKLDGLSGFLQPTDNLLIEAPIGSVDVSTSREQLSYTDRTKQTLSELFVQYETSLIGHIQAETDAQDTFFLGCRAAKAGCDVLGWERAKGLFERIRWNGIPVRAYPFEDTHAGYPVRAMTYTNTPGEKFDASVISTSQINACTRIVVEHSSYRSMERLHAVGALFDGVVSNVLWIRVKKRDVGLLKTQYGLDPSDYTVLDTVKLPPRDKTEGAKTKIRVRQQTSWDGYATKGPVDMLAGGLYIQGNFSSRRRYDYNNYIYLSGTKRDEDDFKCIRSDRFNTFMGEVVKLGLVDRDMPIIIRLEDEDLGEGWTPLGEYLQETLQNALDLSQVTARYSWDDNSFSSELVKLAKGVPTTGMPKVLTDLQIATKALLRKAKTELVLNDHDKILDVLVKLLPSVSVPKTADPSQSINADWEDFIKTHPIFNFMLQEMSMNKYNSRTNDYDCVASEEHVNLLLNYIKMAGL